jgi:hypothetical protein
VPTARVTPAGRSPAGPGAPRRRGTCLQWCYSGVTVVLQWCYSGVTVGLPWCYSGGTAVLQCQ